MFQTSFPVRYYEADPMGVVHHSEYLRYFELARNLWLKEVGYTYDHSLEDNIVFPVVDLECHYKHSARFGQVLTATVEVSEFDMVTATFLQKVIDPQGRVCAEGKVRIAFLNTKLGRPVRCPARLVEKVESLIK